MAIEMCSENLDTACASPRISFSYDLSQAEVVPVEHLLRSNSSSSVDFDFCVFRFEQESSSADELFANGKILPTQIKKHIVQPTESEYPAPPLPPQKPLPQPSHHDVILSDSVKDENMNEMKMGNSESEEKHNSRSFWRFKRSSSLNCGSGYARTLCPLPLLSRSNSTGSAPSGKRSSLSTNSYNCKPNLHRTPSSASIRRSQSSSFSASHQKPPLKKNYGSHGSGSGSGRVNPVLNVPSAKLFGFGSIFSGSKDKNRKK